ncbi:MAG: GGDEF domain-containing response regulator [Cyanobacteriota bacterium]|nr:GGDEF domain-containing response regulator [Cyanobacteriota bacterium]
MTVEQKSAKQGSSQQESEQGDLNAPAKRVKILAIAPPTEEQAALIDWLSDNDFDAISAVTADFALQLAREEKPDLILCDANLPDAKGHEILRLLKQQAETAAIPTIYLAAETSFAEFRQAMDFGADDCLSATTDREILLRAIVTRLEKQDAIAQYYDTKLERLLERDRVTELPTRRALRDRFSQFLDEHDLCHSDKLTGKLIPVLCLSIDRFHRIHDHLGYGWGDRLLGLVAKRLEATNQQGITAYLNAHEFALILNPVTHKREIVDTIQSLLEPLRQPFRVKKQEIFLTASIGISLYPRDGRKIDKLLRRATRAMNGAREKGGNHSEFYTAVLNIGQSNVLNLETEFRRAWKRREFEVYYQPKIDLETGKIICCEALLRWNHSRRGRMTTDKFLPIAEETGLIDEIGEWVLANAAQQVKSWQSEGRTDLRLAVNISSRQFNQIDLRQRIAKILAEVPLPFQYLELEFLESSLIQNPAIATQRLNAFKALGMQLAIDDFGTGYSSLNYLRQFPFNTVKIDPCFIHNLVDRPANQAITSAIIQMAHALNLKVVAEGVETEEELKLLRQYNCDELQGYLFSPPISALEFSRLLQSDKRLV